MTEIAAVREEDLNSWKRCRKIWLVAGLAFGFIGIVGTLICVGSGTETFRYTPLGLLDSDSACVVHRGVLVRET
jgi:hypothetical protein